MLRSARFAALICLAGTLTVLALTAGAPQNTKTITAFAGVGGTIAPHGAVAVSNGADQTFTITTTGVAKIVEVMVDGVSIGSVSTYTFSKVKDNHRIDVTFSSIASVGMPPRKLPG
jgi:hypothetical protein